MNILTKCIPTIKGHIIRQLLTAVYLCWVSFSLCWAQVETPGPNIVWITSEDNSKHYLSLFDQNGVETPFIERLARHGVRFSRAFSNGPVCSVARSTLISGCYAPRLGAQFHRKIKQVPMPDQLEMFPAYLRKAGYYTANHAKEDYNQILPEGVWDESSNQASWRNRAEDQPFFYVHNIGTTHESRLFFTEAEMDEALANAPEDSFYIHPYHPQTKTFHYTNLRYRRKIQQMDREVGEVIQALEQDGLLDNTFIFYFGDHGGVLPGSKGYLKEVGVHVPLVLYIPARYQHLGPLELNTTSDAFVSFIDFAPTVLRLAGVEIPKQMDGRPFWGENMSRDDLQTQNIAFSYADRFDERYDLVRAVRNGQYKYIRNFQPYHADALWNDYRYRQLGYQEWLSLYQKNELNPIQARFFQPKQAEELYDLSQDPFETHNLATEPGFQQTLLALRASLREWILGMPDLSFYPEYVLIRDGAMDQPVAFGKQHKKQIEAYLAVADLVLEDFEKGQKKLRKSLLSKDPLMRYWGLGVCLSFQNQALPLVEIIQQIQASDESLVNRAYATAFLGLIGIDNPVPTMTHILYQSQDPTESLLLLNEMAWLQDMYGYRFAIEPKRLAAEVRSDKLVKIRLAHLLDQH